MTRRDLTDLLGLERRQITRMIEAERKAGHPICASVHGPHYGYFLPATPEELQTYLKSLDHRIREIETTQAALIDAFESWINDGDDPQTDKERSRK